MREGTIVEMYYVMPAPRSKAAGVYPEVVITKHGRYTVETYGRLVYGVMKGGYMHIFDTLHEAAVFSETVVPSEARG